MTLETSEYVEDPDFHELLRGKTFRIYWYLLLQGETGIRELQRELEYSSPNVAAHHLRKLVDAGLVWQNPAHGKYEVKREVKTGVMSLYTRIGSRLIPQNAFLIAFFFTITLCYLLFILIPRGSIMPEDGFFLTTALLGIFFFIRQTSKIWRLKPL
ncbi:MAG: ArsR family transcriptional regulator [Candidatus Hodarchaeales archaeon]